MLKVGLTGGIGAGKSTVASRFAARGVPVIDADVIARALVSPGSEALERIVDHFGADLLKDGALDRAQLRTRIFSDPDERRWLDELLHPRVYAAMAQEAEGLKAPYALLVIPLLFESDGRNFVDRVLWVKAGEACRMARVARRDGLDPETINAIMSAQLGADRLESLVDDTLLNEGDLEALEAAVEALHQRYLRIAQQT